VSKEQIKYAAINPQGQVCGPIGDTEEFVKKALIIGYQNTLLSLDGGGYISKTQIWHKIVEAGYSIKKVRIWIENNG
jgi:hypothetical protein